MKDRFDLSSLAAELLTKTQEGKLKWLRSLPNSFTTAFGQRYGVDVIQIPGIKDQKPEIRLIMRDDLDEVIVGISESEMENPAILQELFNIVGQRTLHPELKVQEAVDTLRKL